MKSLSLKNLFHELRRREVFKTAALYIVGAWVVLQVTELALPALEIPDVAIRYVWIGAILLFPLVLIFGWRYDLSTSGMRRTLPAEAEDEDRALHTSDYWYIGSLSSVTLAVIAFMGLQVSQVEPERLMAPPENSIAVMPFEVCEGAPLDLLLARGLTDEVINRLAERGKLKVIARASVNAYAGFGLSIPEIAKPLGVEYVLKGVVCRDGTTPTLTAELSDEQGFIVWSGSFTQQVNEFEQITSRLASQVADSVAAELGDVLVLQADPPVNSRAYEQLIIGREHHRKRNRDEAQAALEKALEIDPEYADAALALAELQRTFDTLGPNASEGLEEAKAVAQDALTLARRHLETYPNSANTHYVAAYTLSALALWDRKLVWREAAELTEQEIADRKDAVQSLYAEAERHLRTAISLNPNQSKFYTQLAFTLEGQGHQRDADALEVLEQALVRDPLNMTIGWRVAQRWAQRGRFRQAIELLERFKQLPDIPAGAWFSQLELMMANWYWDERMEVLIDILTKYPDVFEDCGGCRHQANQVPAHLALLGLKDHAEAWRIRLEGMEMPDWMRWAGRRAYLLSSGQEDLVNEELVEQVAGMSNEEVLDAWSGRGGAFASALAEVGEYDRAIELMESIRHSFDTWAEREAAPPLGLATMYRAAGRVKEAQPLFQEVVDYLEAEYDAGIRHPWSLYNLATAYLGLGRDDEALEMLRKAVDYHLRIPSRGFRDSGDLGVVMWQRLHDDPRFIAQLNRMQADLDQQAERVKAMLAQHDVDELLAPLMALAPETEEASEQ